MIEGELSKVFLEANPCEPLDSAAQYSVFPGGKRIRPIIALLLFQDLHQDARSLLRASLALEVYHCATLIHDDLPCMDDDDFRRGRPSCHKAFGEATALLAGDYLSSLSFKCLATADLPGGTKEKLLELLAQSSMEVCEGQQLDLMISGANVDFSKIHRLKTASLFRAAAGFAAHGAELSRDVVEELLNFGTWLGVGFQLLNDLIDAFGTPQERGRPESSDQKNHKQTIARFDHGRSSELINKVEREANLCLERASLKTESSFIGTREIMNEIILNAKTLKAS